MTARPNKNFKYFLFIGTVVLFLIVNVDLAIEAKQNPAKLTRMPDSHQANVAKKTLSNNWYTIQAGSQPWGYYHEVIEEVETGYSYRYEMKRKENSGYYYENLGTLVNKDLTTRTFNLNKAGDGIPTEVTNATYKEEKGIGVVRVDVKGGRNLNYERRMSKKTIFESIVPLWFRQNWSTLKPKSKGLINILTEDPTDFIFLPKDLEYEVTSFQSKDKCMEIKVKIDRMRQLICLDDTGAMVRIDIPATDQGDSIQVRRVKNEKEAKSFLPAQ